MPEYDLPLLLRISFRSKKVYSLSFELIVMISSRNTGLFND
jgi:hypothetical protein